MSRKPPSDNFTRFTSTAPQASRSPSTSLNRRAVPSQTSIPQRPSHIPSDPNGETPAQKVARLRAASRQAKERAQLSTTDRIIARGRFWADVAHRVTTYGLLAFTGVSSVVAVYGIVSLVSHNRRQKRAWIEREMDRLHDAQQAFLRGEANAEQLHLLEQERAGEEIAKKFKEDKEKRKAEGIFGRVKGTFGNFLGQGDKGLENTKRIENVAEIQGERSQALQKTLEGGWVEGEVILQQAAVQESNIAGVGLDEKGRPVPINKLEQVSRKINNERRTGEREIQARTGVVGGPLDVLAGNVATAVIPSSTTNSGSNSWWSWVSTSSSNSNSNSSSNSSK